MSYSYSPAVLLALQCAVLCFAAVAPDPIHDGEEHRTSSRTININFSGSTESAKQVPVLLNSSKHLQLSCTFNFGHPVKVIWVKGDLEIFNETALPDASGNATSTCNVSINNSNDLGSYACKSDTLNGTFNLKVPATEGREKPLVSYVGDTAVLKCKTHEPHKHSLGPLRWKWYKKSEELEKAALGENTTSDRYVVKEMFVNEKYETVLNIKSLTEEDNGIYVCSADFQVGKSSGEVNLKVLSYMVPLKPFLIIVAEVIVLVALILLYEVYSKKKQKTSDDDDKEAEQAESLKPEGTNGMEESSARQRKV